MIYFLRPSVSGFTDNKWDEFYDGAFEVLKKFKPYKIMEVTDLKGLSTREKNDKNLLIYFVPVKETSGVIKVKIEKMLDEVTESNWEIYPVAPDKENRFPSKVVDTSQSYDIVNELHQRKLTDEYFKLVGRCFARVVIVSRFTASFKKETKMFMSHRRFDGEDKVNFIKDAANSRHEDLYVDLHEITVGQDAQEEIERRLETDTDILIFLQTSSTYESFYQLEELKKALELDIPVLWVTVGLKDEKEYGALPIHPVGKPHLCFEELNSQNVQDIFSTAFEILSLKKQRLLDKVMYKLSYLEEKGLKVEELCDLENIYMITEENESYSTGEIQALKTLHKFLCRKFEDNDTEGFDKYNKDLEYYQGNIVFGTQSNDKEIPVSTRVRSYKKFFESRNTSKINGSVVISGSFPKDQSLKYQLDLIDAVSTLTEDILKCDGDIIFGAHPSFQGLILEKVKRFNTKTRKRVKTYVSTKFRGLYESNIEYFEKNSILYEVEGKGDTMSKEDITLSLTEMRKAMINDKDAIALVVLGGQEPEDSLSGVPGIDEEIMLAKEKGIPVYIIGSVGGRGATLVSEGGSDSLSGEAKDIVEVEDNFKWISETIIKDLDGK